MFNSIAKIELFILISLKEEEESRKPGKEKVSIKITAELLIKPDNADSPLIFFQPALLTDFL